MASYQGPKEARWPRLGPWLDFEKKKTAGQWWHISKVADTGVLAYQKSTVVDLHTIEIQLR